MNSRASGLTVASAMIVVAVAPMVLLQYFGVVDPYLYNWAAAITESVNNHQLSETYRYAPASGVLLATISMVSGLDATSLVFAPVNGLVILLATLSFARALTPGPLTAALVVIAVSYLFAAPYFSTWPHGFGFSLYAIVLLLLFRNLNRPRSSGRALRVAALVIVVLAVYFYSYSVSLWVAALLIAMAAFSLIAGWTSPSVRGASLSLFMALLVINATFNPLLYDSFIPKMDPIALQGSLSSLASRLPFLGTGSQPDVRPFAAEQPTPTALRVLTMVLLLGSALPILLDVRRTLARRSVSSKASLVASSFRLSVASVLLADLVAYGLMGVLFLRYVYFVFPILSASAISTSSPRIARRYGILIASLAITVFVWNWSLGYGVKAPTRLEAVQAIADWRNRSIGDAPRPLVGDHHTLGQMDVMGAESGHRIPPTFFDESTFALLVEPDASQTGFTSPTSRTVDIVINRTIVDKKTWAGGWHDYEPLAPHMRSIPNNPNFGTVYDDGRFWYLRGR